MANKKKRLIDLDVDEVSLVDKPAIGETVYLTKRAEGAKVTTKKKGKEPVKKDDAGGTTEPDTVDASSLEKRLAKVESSFQGLQKSIGDVEAMLTQSLQLHETVTVHLNEMLSLNLGALDMCMMLMEESTDETEAPAEGATENQTMSLLTELRESVKAVRQEVAKAGAKMSRTRLQALRDIAAKLSELITSVEPVEAEATEGNAGGKKKSALVSVTKQFKSSLETATAEIGECMNQVGELKKAHAGLEERLKGLEGTAGASDAIGDDDEDTTKGGDSPSTQKSVFAGIIPVDRIKESVRKRNETAKR